MTRTRKIVIGCLGLPLLLVTSLAAALFWDAQRMVIVPPLVVGVRKDARGSVVEQIVFAESYNRGFGLPGPCGSLILGRTYHRQLFLEAAGQPRHELTFLQSATASEYLPVAGSPLWLADMSWGDSVWLIILDRTQVVRQLQYNAEPGRDDQYFWLENGNRTVVHRVGERFEALDVVTGAVTKRATREG